MPYIFSFLLLSVAFTVMLYLSSYKMLQIFQMSSYRCREVFAWLKKTKFDYIGRYFALAFFSFVPTAIFVACFSSYELVALLGGAFFIGLAFCFFVITKRQAKVKLKFTKRVIRLSVILVILYALSSAAITHITASTELKYAYTTLLALFIPPFTFLAAIIASPLENLIARSFKKKAQRKLDSNKNLIKIGITGSFGKTTAKNILATMLEKKYSVCASPKSYNTPMGLTRVINESLTPSHEVFIAEMGARYVGDILELCALVKPNIGMLTAIGDMHLETFKTKENLIKTKCELFDGLSEDGLSVLCGGTTLMDELYEIPSTKKLISNSEKSKLKCTTENVSTSEKGTSFDLKLDGKVASITTRLLGAHIPSLIAVCALVAHELGVSLEEIANACSELKPVPHRLELIQNGDTTVIDDAYNSNPEGAKNALEVLSSFSGTKIIITPGMVELGDASAAIHREFGRQIAAVADYAILIGRNSTNIKEGILEGPASSRKTDLSNATTDPSNVTTDPSNATIYPSNVTVGPSKVTVDLSKVTTDPSNVFIVKTLKDAMEILLSIRADKKIVLFENDLPDNY